MTPLEQPRAGTSQTLRVLLLLLGSDWAEVVGHLWRLGKRVLALKIHEGLYEVLDYEATLQLDDTKGEKAVLHKRERVRFLQDNILAYQDQAWGDGDIFADYRCSPGVVADRYRDGHLYRILISLRATKHRGDTEEFHIERTIKRGFTRSVEDFQIDINHTTRKFAMSVVFPAKRLPRQVTLVEQNVARTLPLGAEHRHILPDGRHQYTWSTRRPRLFEAYIVRWVW